MKKQSDATWELHMMAEQIDWDLVYTLELPRIYNFFLFKVGNREFAQDLTATTFERAWKHRSKYRPTSAEPTTWLFGIVRNVLKENLRKNRMNERKIDAISRKEEKEAKADIEEIIQQRQEKERLRVVILELPEREQELIALKYGAGLTNREIAKITNLSESNVGSILHRTVNTLRIRWEDEYGR